MKKLFKKMQLVDLVLLLPVIIAFAYKLVRL